MSVAHATYASAVRVGMMLNAASHVSAGILYTSRETHYSVMKAARMYRMDAVEVCIGSGLMPPG